MSTKIGHQARSLMGKGHKGAGSTAREHRQRAEKIGDFMQAEGLQNIEHMKLKHAVKYIESLKERGLSDSSLANHATTLRIVADKIGKGSMIDKNNEAAFGFSNRPGAERFNPVATDREKVEQVRQTLEEKGHGWAALGYEMSKEFGLRRAESLKSNLTVEREGKTYLVVELSKGNKYREVEVRTPSQMDVLDRVQAHLAGKRERSLIPDAKSLKQGLQCYSNHVSRAEGTKATKAHSHANRHAHVQDMRADGASSKEIDRETGHGEGRGIWKHYSD